MATSAHLRDQLPQNRVSARHYVSSETDQDYSEENEGSDTLDNLEDSVDELSQATREGMAGLEFIISIIFSVMPEEAFRKVGTYARTSDKKDLIEYFLSDLIRFNNGNTNNRGLSPGSDNAAMREMDLRQAGPGPLAVGEMYYSSHPVAIRTHESSAKRC